MGFVSAVCSIFGPKRISFHIFGFLHTHTNTHAHTPFPTLRSPEILWSDPDAIQSSGRDPGVWAEAGMINRLGLIQVGDLVATLEKWRLLESTYIIVTSDHGYHLGQFALAVDKRLPYETDIRVPLLIRGPGIEPGSRVAAPVVSIDLAPTVLHMARIPTPADMDGVSLLPLLAIDPPLRPKVRYLINELFASSLTSFHCCCCWVVVRFDRLFSRRVDMNCWEYRVSISIAFACDLAR